MLIDHKQLTEDALRRLRRGPNPFGFTVAVAGSEDQCRLYDVPELLQAQRADLRAVIESYRDKPRPSQVFPVLGETGAGKSHLLAVLQDDLERDSLEAGQDCLFATADHYATGADPVDFFRGQVINALLSGKSSAKRFLDRFAQRLTSRLLGEAIRQKSPNELMGLIPARTAWEGFSVWLGNRATSQAKQEAIGKLLVACEIPGASDVRDACAVSGVPPEAAAALVEAHLERRETKDTTGHLRKELYRALARFALLGDRDRLDDYLTAGYAAGPEHVAAAGQLGKRLLAVLVEAFQSLRIPVVLVFDQLENYVRDPNAERSRDLSRQFAQALAALVNNVAGLCIVILAEETLWHGDVLSSIDRYSADRLHQSFTLPGRPTQPHIRMPSLIPYRALVDLVRKRVATVLGDFDTTGLSETFPFEEPELRSLSLDLSPRGLLRSLAGRYDGTVFCSAPGPEPRPGPESRLDGDSLRSRLRAHWQAAMAGARRELPDGPILSAQLADLQSYLDQWLRQLHQIRMTGAGPWSRVDLMIDAAKFSFGYLNVVRDQGPNDPGIGLAIWVGERMWRLRELNYRVDFFTNKPCPIRTLVLLRQDGEAALAGETGNAYDAAIAKGRDVRVVEFNRDKIAAVIAMPRWLQAIAPDVEAFDSEAHAQRNGRLGTAVEHELVQEYSRDLLEGINTWRQPRTQ